MIMFETNEPLYLKRGIRLKSPTSLILIRPHFPVQIRGVHKWNMPLWTPLGLCSLILLAMITLSAVQSCLLIRLKDDILFIDTSNNAWHNQVHSPNGMPYLAIIASNDRSSIVLHLLCNPGEHTTMGQAFTFARVGWWNYVKVRVLQRKFSCVRKLVINLYRN